MNFNKNDNIKMLYLSHSNMWECLEKIKEDNDNVSIDFYKGSTYYIKNKNQYEDCDFIIFYSSFGYADFEEHELKELGSRISNQKGKRVSVGYSYVIPKEQRTDLLKNLEVKIYSFKEESEYEDTISAPEYFTPIDLMKLVISIHSELENSKIKKIEPTSNLRK